MDALPSHVKPEHVEVVIDTPSTTKFASLEDTATPTHSADARTVSQWSVVRRDLLVSTAQSCSVLVFLWLVEFGASPAISEWMERTFVDEAWAFAILLVSYAVSVGLVISTEETWIRRGTCLTTTAMQMLSYGCIDMALDCNIAFLIQAHLAGSVIAVLLCSVIAPHRFLLFPDNEDRSARRHVHGEMNTSAAKWAILAALLLFAGFASRSIGGDYGKWFVGAFGIVYLGMALIVLVVSVATSLDDDHGQSVFIGGPLTLLGFVVDSILDCSRGPKEDLPLVQCPLNQRA